MFFNDYCLPADILVCDLIRGLVEIGSIVCKEILCTWLGESGIINQIGQTDNNPTHATLTDVHHSDFVQGRFMLKLPMLFISISSQIDHIDVGWSTKRSSGINILWKTCHNNRQIAVISTAVTVSEIDLSFNTVGWLMLYFWTLLN